METIEHQFQRRAIVGQWHFILVNAEQPDIWALPGAVVIASDENGIRRFGPTRTITTSALKAWAYKAKLPFRIEERYPVIRRASLEELAA